MGIRKINYTVIAPEVEQEIKDKYTKQEIDTMLDDKVDNSRVLTNVPANAKFTDTTYTEISTAEIDAGTSTTLRTITGRRIKYILDKVQSWISALTKADIGLENVDNIQQASKVEFNAHNSDNVRHITSTERTTWNNKWDYDEDIIKNVKVNSASNADTVNGKTVAENVPVGAKFTDTVYTHPTTPGNKHIPSGGSNGQYLKWSADGTAVWDTIADGLELGETSGTAYRGDRGKIAYDHSQSSHAPIDSISKSNTTIYTPTLDYHPATKKYVDDNSGLIIP